MRWTGAGRAARSSDRDSRGGAIRRRLAAVLPTLAAAACALGLVLSSSPALAEPQATTPLRVAVAAAPAAGQATTDTVTVTIGSLSPEVLTSHHDLTITGTVANGTKQALSSVTLQVAVQARTPLSTSALTAFLTDATDDALTTVLSQDLDHAVPAGQTRAFTLTVPFDSLPLGSSDQWGPRGVQVSALGSGTALAQDRTVMVWDDGVSVSPSQVTAVVPVTASAAELAVLTSPSSGASSTESATSAPSAPASASPTASTAAAATPGAAATESATAEPTGTATAEPTGTATAASIAQQTSTPTVAEVRERVLGLLGLAGDGVVLAVDPALMEALGVPVPDASTVSTASASPSALPADGDVRPSVEPSDSTATPTATSEPTAAEAAASTPAASTPAASSSTRTDDELVAALRTAVSNGDVVALPWSDADVSALAHVGRSDLITSAEQRSSVSGTVAEGASTGVSWVAGPLDTSTLGDLGDSTTTVIASPGDLPVGVDLTYTPSGTTVVGGRTVLIPDADLSAALGGRLTHDGEESVLSDLDSRQLLRAESAILTRQAPSLSRDVVVTVSRAEAASTDPEVLGQRLRALTDSSWTSGQGLDALLTDADQSAANGSAAARTALPDTASSSGEVTAAELREATDTASYLSSVASVLTDPTALLGGEGDVVATTTSASWRSAPSARSADVASARAIATQVAAALTAVPSSTINLISSSAELPVRIMSDLDQEVTVRVHVVPSSQRLQADADTTVTVPAAGEVTATVPVTAVGSGDIDLTIEVLAADGTVVGTPTTVHMRVRADWENVGTRVIGLGLVLMLAVGITRTVRRGRRPVIPQEKA